MTTAAWNASADFLASLFLWSGVSKIRSLGKFGEEIAAFGLFPRWFGSAIAAVLPPLEIVAGGWLLSRVQMAFAAGLVFGLLAVFIIFVGWALASGKALSCYCFGESDGRIGSVTFFRNLILLVLAGLLLLGFGGSGIIRLEPVDRMTSMMVGSSATLIFLAGVQLASLGQARRRGTA
jgi:hypothetical protein